MRNRFIKLLFAVFLIAELFGFLIYAQPFTVLVDSTVKPPTQGILVDSIEVWNNPDCYKFDEYTWVRTKRETTKEDYYTVDRIDIWQRIKKSK